MNSSELRGFLTGLILGDGHICKGVKKRAFEIKSIHYDFINNIKSEIHSASGFKTKTTFVPEHTSGGCHHKNSWRFDIVAHPYFAKMYHHFYDDNGHRRITREALNWLTPYGLANWYMSDGYVCLVGRTKGKVTSRRVDLCTDRYTYRDIERIQRHLFGRFNILTNIIKRGRFYRLRVQMASYESFFTCILPYLVPSMLYKAYLGYEQKPKWMSDYLWAIQENLKSADPLALTA